MAALTADAIVDRVRSICAGAPFELVEAVSWETFEYQPTTNVDAVFRIPPPQSGTVVGGFSYTEDRTDVLEVWIARKHDQDFAGVRKTLLRDVHSLTAAIVRDGTSVSGDYQVPDNDRRHAITIDKDAEYAVLMLSLGVNYDAQL